MPRFRVHERLDTLTIGVSQIETRIRRNAEAGLKKCVHPREIGDSFGILRTSKSSGMNLQGFSEGDGDGRFIPNAARLSSGDAGDGGNQQ